MKFREILSSGFAYTLRFRRLKRPSAGVYGHQTSLPSLQGPSLCRQEQPLQVLAGVNDQSHRPEDPRTQNSEGTPESTFPHARSIQPHGSPAFAHALIRGTFDFQARSSLGSAAVSNQQRAGVYDATSIHTRAASAADLKSLVNLVDSAEPQGEIPATQMHAAEHGAHARGVAPPHWRMNSSTPGPRSTQARRPWISLEEVDTACSSIQALVKNEAGASKEQVAKIMHTWNNLIDSKLLTAILSKQRDPGVAWLVLEWAETQTGFAANIFHFTKLLQIAGEAKDFEFVDKFVSELHGRGLEPCIRIFNTLISKYSRAGMVGRVVEIHAEMEQMGVAPNVVTMNSLITAYGRAGMIKEMEEVYKDIDGSKFRPTLITMNAMIDGYAKAGMISEMDRFYKGMGKRGLKPDEVTLSAMINGYAKIGKVHEMERLYRDMQDKGLELNLITLSTMIGGYGKAGMLSEMEKIYKTMVARGVKPDQVTLSAMIDGYGKGGKIKEMEKVYKTMQERKFNVNKITFTAIVNGYGKNGMIEEMETVHESMKEAGLVPDSFTINAMIDAYAKTHSYSEMEGIYMQMKGSGIRPTAVTLNTMIDGYGTVGMIDEMERVYEDMKEEGINPTPGTVTSLIKCYGKKGMVAKIEALLPVIQEAGLMDDVAVRWMLEEYYYKKSSMLVPHIR